MNFFVLELGLKAIVASRRTGGAELGWSAPLRTPNASCAVGSVCGAKIRRSECPLGVMERRTRRNHFSSAALSITDDLLHHSEVRTAPAVQEENLTFSA